MRDLHKESIHSDATVDRARGKVAVQTKLIERMATDDPGFTDAQRLLVQMQYSASAAETTRAMLRYDVEDDS